MELSFSTIEDFEDYRVDAYREAYELAAWVVDAIADAADENNKKVDLDHLEGRKVVDLFRESDATIDDAVRVLYMWHTSGKGEGLATAKISEVEWMLGLTFAMQPASESEVEEMEQDYIDYLRGDARCLSMRERY